MVVISLVTITTGSHIAGNMTIDSHIVGNMTTGSHIVGDNDQCSAHCERLNYR